MLLKGKSRSQCQACLPKLSGCRCEQIDLLFEFLLAFRCVGFDYSGIRSFRSEQVCIDVVLSVPD